MTCIPPKNELASNIGVLYKYIKIETIEDFNRAIAMIKDKSLWFWHVTGQNDKYECKPKVFFGGDFRARYKYFREDLKKAYPELPSRSVKEKARKAARKPNIPSTNSVYDYWAICCFSAKGNCPHLWKAYAGDGKGIVIEYDAKEGSSIGFAGKVQYTDKKVLLDILKIDVEKCYEIFTTKTKEWEVEQEYRIVERLPKPNEGKNFFYSDLKIKSVGLGKDLSKNFSDQLVELCKESNVTIYKN